MLGPSSFCLTTCVAWVSDFFNISWVFLAPDTSPTLFFTGTCYTFNTLVVEFCLGRHLSVCLHASRGCPIFLNICWVSLAPDTSPTLLLRGTCYTFNTLVVEFCLGRHLSVCLHASRGCPIFLNICWVSLVPGYRRPAVCVLARAIRPSPPKYGLSRG